MNTKFFAILVIKCSDWTWSNMEDFNWGSQDIPVLTIAMIFKSEILT